VSKLSWYPSYVIFYMELMTTTERSSLEPEGWLHAFRGHVFSLLVSSPAKCHLYPRPTSPSPHIHRRLLERLVGSQPQEDNWSLQHYVLFYCVRKIHGRLSMKYGTDNRLLDTVLSVSTAQVTEAFQAEMDGEAPEHIRRHDESWLLKLEGCDTLRLGPPNKKGRCMLERSAHNEGLLWLMLIQLLVVLRETTTTLVKLRGRHRTYDVDDIEFNMSILDSALQCLDLLVSRSGSIWRLLRNTAIVTAITVSRNMPWHRRRVDVGSRSATPVLNSISLLPRTQTLKIRTRLTLTPLWIHSGLVAAPYTLDSCSARH
jgi:hypothetical protein